MPTVSVIIPVYNVAAYLEQCVNSVRSQTLADWELILIDDGCTDGSQLLCDQLAAADSRISVVHQENHGVAYCRNVGIQRACGQWVAFVDSDDWLEPAYLQVLLDGALHHDADVSICGRSEEHRNLSRPLPVCQTAEVLTGQEAMRRVYRRDMQSCLWATLLRRTLLQEPVPSYPRFEDHAVLYKWFSHGQRVVLLPDMPYHFRVRSSSLMHRTIGNGEAELMPIVDEIYKYIGTRALLPDADNRAIAAENYVRIAKEVARSQSAERQQLLSKLRAALCALQPVDDSLLGSKSRRRMHLLLRSPRLFSWVLSFSQLFVTRHSSSSRQLFD